MWDPFAHETSVLYVKRGAKFLHRVGSFGAKRHATRNCVTCFILCSFLRGCPPCYFLYNFAMKTMMKNSVVALSLALLTVLSLREASAFAPATRTTRHYYSRLGMSPSAPPPPSPENNNSDFPPEEQMGSGSDEYQGSVDWDAEWKKVVQSGATATEDRPGKDFYKSDAEIAATKLANKATQQVNKVAENIPAAPSWNQLKGDWRFWVGVLAVLSVGSSLLAAAGSPQPLPTNASPDSYYI